MAQNRADIADLHQAWVAEVSRTWGWVLALGLLFTVLGIIGLGMTFLVTVASMLFFGVLLFGGAIFHLIQMFRMSSWRGSAVQAVITILYLVAGGFVIAEPVTLAVAFTLIVGIALIGIGIMRIVGSLHVRPMPGWGWLTANGIIDIVLGLLILAGWPATGLWVLGMFISIDLMVSGIAYIVLAFWLNRRPLPVR